MPKDKRLRGSLEAAAPKEKLKSLKNKKEKEKKKGLQFSAALTS